MLQSVNVAAIPGGRGLPASSVTLATGRTALIRGGPNDGSVCSSQVVLKRRVWFCKCIRIRVGEKGKLEINISRHKSINAFMLLRQ